MLKDIRKSGSNRSKSGSKSGSNRRNRSKSGSKSSMKVNSNCFIVAVDESGFLTKNSLTEQNLVNYVKVLLNDNKYVSLLLNEQNMQNVARIYSTIQSNPSYLHALVQDKNLLDEDYFNRNVVSYITETSWHKLGKLIDYISTHSRALKPVKQSRREQYRHEISLGVGGAPPGAMQNILHAMVGTMIASVTFNTIDGSIPIPLKMDLFVTSVAMNAPDRMRDLSTDDRRAIIVFKSRLDPGFQLKICKFSCNVQNDDYDDTHLDPYKWEYYMYDELHKYSGAGGYNVEAFTHCLQFNRLPATDQLTIPASITGGTDLTFHVSDMVTSTQLAFISGPDGVRNAFKAFMIIGNYSTNHITMDRYLDWNLGEINTHQQFDVQPYINGLVMVINNIDAAFRQTGFVHCDAKVDNLLIEVNIDGTVNRALIFDLDFSYFVDSQNLDILIPLQGHNIIISADNRTLTNRHDNYKEQRPACYRWWQNLPHDLYTPHLAHIFDSILMAFSHFWTVIDYIHSPPNTSNQDVINTFNIIGREIVRIAESTNDNTTIRYFAVAWNMLASAINQQQIEDYSGKTANERFNENFDLNDRFPKMELNNIIRIFVNPARDNPGVGVTYTQLLIPNPLTYKYFTVLPLNSGLYPLNAALDTMRGVMRQHRDS